MTTIPIAPARRRPARLSAQQTIARRIADAGDWRADAECDSADPELFFPLDAAGARKPIRIFCRRCAVVDECGAFADATGAVGVWGGRFR